MEEYIEELTLIKESSFEDKSYYIFQNEKGEFRTLQTNFHQYFSLQPGMVLKGRLRKRGCAGREIIELMPLPTID